MGDFKILQQEITPFVEESLQNEDIQNVKITITGTSAKGDGFMGDIIYVQVTGINKSNENIELNLILKTGKKNEMMREKLGVRNIYLREVYVYDKILPTFSTFQKARGIKNIFDSVPKCYKTIVLDDKEILVLENLKRLGYQLHDKQITMNYGHISLILDNYAKLHAISFALRDQNKEEFDNLTADYAPVQKKWIAQEGMNEWYDKAVIKLAEMIQGTDEELAKLVLKVFNNKLLDMLREVLNAEVKESVIIHGDCWNNNFLFKYENSNLETPTAVKILDWQISCLHSPVMDLSYFLYIVSSPEEIARFDEYLQLYHCKLSEYIQQLGSDPEKLFPFSTLIDHFKKYSAYGISFLIHTLELMLADKEDAFSFDEVGDTANSQDMQTWTGKIKLENQKSYQDRTIAGVRHYLRNVIKAYE